MNLEAVLEGEKDFLADLAHAPHLGEVQKMLLGGALSKLYSSGFDCRILFGIITDL